MKQLKHVVGDKKTLFPHSSWNIYFSAGMFCTFIEKQIVENKTCQLKTLRGWLIDKSVMEPCKAPKMEGPGMLLKPCIDNTNYKVFGSISPFKSKPPAFHSILSS